MSPFSQERAEWVEARLFCLARMSREVRADGAKNARQFMTNDGHEAHMLANEALKSINVERLQLMAERTAIKDYEEENPERSAALK